MDGSWSQECKITLAQKSTDRRKAKVAYLYDGDTVITYEDKQALQAKVSYVKEKTWLVPW
ncbi:hypothetical protein [Brevibacillus laterosporus]|nr:hypothetical protein [Brevibacillus laterosporus]